jgi:hypothetical protein
MAIIDTSIDIDRQLTIHTVTGEVLSDEISNKIKTYNESGPTKFILWDFSEASLKKITSSQIEAFVTLTKQYSNLRKGGKTALVFSSDFGFGLGRVFDIHQDLVESEIPHMTFRSKELALNWLLK